MWRSGILSPASTLCGVLALTSCLSAEVRASRDAAARCADAIHASSQLPSEERAVVLARACASMFKERACRDAFASFNDPDPADRAQRLTTACAAAYCAHLSPAPSLCTRPATSAQDLAHRAPELFAAISRHDHGGSGFSPWPLVTPVTVALPPPTPSCARVRVELSIASDGAVTLAHGDDAHVWREGESLRGVLGPWVAGSCACGVDLAASEDTPFEAIRAVVGELGELGCARLSFEVKAP